LFGEQYHLFGYGSQPLVARSGLSSPLCVNIAKRQIHFIAFMVRATTNVFYSKKFHSKKME